MLLYLCLLIAAAREGFSYPDFRQYIPNGNRVPDPCNPGSVWSGVGHLVAAGQGSRNQFGKDFKEMMTLHQKDKMWKAGLCGLDSDGDGRTNGEELGDPGCDWSVGKGGGSIRNDSLSHPGVCEPIDSEKCIGRNTDFEILCQNMTFECPALAREGAQPTILQYPLSAVPAQVTTYHCMVFDLSQTLDMSHTYHIIAIEPYIEQRVYLHHMIYTLCYDYRADYLERAYSSPSPCGMSFEEGCVILGGWAPGSSGLCFHDDVGFLVDNSRHHLIIQVHYNNVAKTGGVYERPGAVIHTTNQTRQYNAAFITAGKAYFVIPPKTARYDLAGWCRPDLLGDVNIVAILPHMHYAGVHMHVEKGQLGSSKVDMVATEEFQYDRPIFHQYETPVKLTPTTNLSWVCGYNTCDRNYTTKFGAATDDEMCFAFIMVYPDTNVGHFLCLDIGGAMGSGARPGACDMETTTLMNDLSSGGMTSVVWFTVMITSVAFFVLT